jgi:DNA-binding CsgD family transcriptional regulator
VITPRHTEILGLVAEGLSNQEIARRLYISPRTVDTHLRAIFLRLHTQNRAGAVTAAWRAGLLPLPGVPR